MEILNEISLMLQKGKMRDVKSLVQKALDEGVDAKRILDEGLLSAMDIIGAKFKNNEVYVPEVLIAARAMNAGAELLKPKLMEDGVESIGKVVICTVKGDLHDIGKNLVKMMMEGKGLDVIDLGVDISPEKVIEAIDEHNPNIVALSSLLTTTMVEQKNTIDALVAAGVRDRVKVMIGGAPVTEAFAKEIGADSYTSDAATAAEVAKSYVCQSVC